MNVHHEYRGKNGKILRVEHEDHTNIIPFKK